MNLIKWLSITDRFTKACLDERFAPLGINSSQHMYLLKICDQPGIPQDTLLEYFYVHPSNIVRMIAALERNGFLRKDSYDRDRRTCRLYPTEKALAIADQVRRICNEVEGLLTDGLSEEEQRQLCRILYRAGKRMSGEMGVKREDDEPKD